MKKIIFFIAITCLIISCKENKTQINKQETSKTKKTITFNWLLGNWERTNDEEGKKTFENWIKKSKIEYIGLGFTMKANDTISSEKMQLIKINNKWQLIVRVVGKGDDTSATTFNMINKSTDSFTCENKEIDFPNTIQYKKDGKKLKAIVSNSELKIPFEFERLVR